MSTEPYPDVSGRRIGNCAASERAQCRMAEEDSHAHGAELDRLTIDSAGRFYWDGKLVNYEPPQAEEPEPKPADAADRSAMEILDRAAYELDAHKVPEPIEGAELPRAVGHPCPSRARAHAVDFDMSRHVEEEPPAAAVPVARTMTRVDSHHRTRPPVAVVLAVARRDHCGSGHRGRRFGRGRLRPASSRTTGAAASAWSRATAHRHRRRLHPGSRREPISRPRAVPVPSESGTRSRFLHWSHFLRRTGFHFAGKCSSSRVPPPSLVHRGPAGAVARALTSADEAGNMPNDESSAGLFQRAQAQL